MRRPWILPPSMESPPELQAAVGGHPLVARLLAQRGLDSPAKAIPFLDPQQYTPAPPHALVGLARAAELLVQAIHQGQNILVWGDFDVDGQTSTALLVAALRELAGPHRVRFHVPNRFTEGHGIHPPTLQAYLADPAFRPQVLLTCDTGIAEGPGIGLAKDAGLTVIVTDHHDLPPEFGDHEPGTEPPAGYSPDQVGRASVRRADALVDPKFLHPSDPLRTLPGVGVAYKLVQQLYHHLGRPGEATPFLDLVALGIVADVAEQVHDTRYLLQLGLERLRRTERVGLKALMHYARIVPDTVDAEDIGFQLGPRMNALGRLDDATVAVELLTTQDPIRAGQLAAQMERLNHRRRLLTSQITRMAFDILDRHPHLLDFEAIVLAHPNWHPGIVGIVASRLVEEFGKPTVLLLNPPGQPARGSARSVPGVDIGAAIAACGPLLLGHGGHPGAAGVTLPPENIDRFRRELSRQVARFREDTGPQGLHIDAELPFPGLDLALAEQVQRLAPFGNGNPKPVFLSRELTVVEDRLVGKDGLHRRLVLRDAQGTTQPAIWFRGADVELPSGPLDLAYTLDIHRFRGQVQLQLGFVAARPAEKKAVDLSGRAPSRPAVDLRGKSVARAELPSREEAFWLAEGIRLGEIALGSRLEARDAPRGRPLVLWSIPPSPQVLEWLLEALEPSAVWVVGRETTDDSLAGVLRQIAGMCKYALRGEGRVEMERLAARIGSTPGVVRRGLLWLEVRGLVRVVEWEQGDVACIRSGDGLVRDEAERALLQEELRELLAEIRAYRRFFRRARLEQLGLEG